MYDSQPLYNKCVMFYLWKLIIFNCGLPHSFLQRYRCILELDALKIMSTTSHYKVIYIFNISVFKLHILLKKNYTKHNVSRLMTILSSPNSLNNFEYIYTYIFVVKHQLNHVYWLMRIERSETICINEYENWEALLYGL